MWRSEVRDEVLRAVRQGSESVATVATRLGVPVATARTWVRAERPVGPAAPTFAKVVAEMVGQTALVVRIGAAEIEVRVGFDAGLLRQVVDALGGEA